MKNVFLLIVSSLSLMACDQPVEKVRGIPPVEKVKAEMPSTADLEKQLQNEGYQTFSYEEGDTTYLMQQYFMVFLKQGKDRSQDSLEAAKLQEQHLAHLSRMAKEGYASLVGPIGSDGEIKGIVVYNTPTLEEADSLARLDPAVKAGRLEVEVHPWWTAKGGKLQ